MKNKTMYLKNSPYVEYTVCTLIYIYDEKGNLTNEYSEEKFKSKNMLANRKRAIIYYDLAEEIYASKKNNFSNFLEAKIKGFKDCKYYSMWIEVNHDNYFFCLDSNSEVFFSLLSYESKILKNEKQSNFMFVNDYWGNQHKVLEEDYELLEKHLNLVIEVKGVLIILNK
jgi:hypothetical protein